MATKGRVSAPDYEAFVNGLNALMKRTSVEMIADDVWLTPLDRDWNNSPTHRSVQAQGVDWNHEKQKWELHG